VNLCSKKKGNASSGGTSPAKILERSEMRPGTGCFKGRAALCKRGGQHSNNSKKERSEALHAGKEDFSIGALMDVVSSFRKGEKRALKKKGPLRKHRSGCRVERGKGFKSGKKTWEEKSSLFRINPK